MVIKTSKCRRGESATSSLPAFLPEVEALLLVSFPPEETEARSQEVT